MNESNKNDNGTTEATAAAAETTETTTTKTTNKWCKNLPKPPVPELATTMARYLAGLESVVVGGSSTSQQQQLVQTQDQVRQFTGPGGLGHRLQERLLEYARRTDNWVTDFWLDDMYLNNPVPLIINSNPFFLLPRETFKTTSQQIHYAATMINFALKFKEMIDSETLPQDAGGGQKKYQPLCMETYRNFFTACRIPGPVKDELVLHRGQNHFVVAAFNQFHVVHLPATSRPSVDELERCLLSIWNRAKNRSHLEPNVGILTGENRRVWSQHRKQLASINPANAECLRYLETSLFIVCLDDFVLPSRSATKPGYRNSIQLAKMDASYMSSMLLHGGGSQLHTANRWFDKFLQLVISKEGICGVIAEHSASEGMTILNFLERFLQYQRKRNSSRLARQNTVDMMKPGTGELRIQPLQWQIDENLAKCLKSAEKQVDRLVMDLDLYVLRFAEFGREFIKQQRISPDVFIQLALQLTHFKLHRCLVSTYESCSLRQFRLGRVDNIRASTREALEWARAMCANDNEPNATSEHQKIALFKRAIEKQTEVLKYTSAGFGPDNHLLALRELSKTMSPTSGADQLPASLFREKSYKEYLNFRLSTSQLATTEDILVGYGPVVPDGYGCSYMPKDDHINFCVSSFYGSDETSSDFFALSLEGSLLQMRELCTRM